MPKMVIERNYFKTLADAMEDIRNTGYWPCTYISDRSPELPLHYHGHDVIGYVMEGETYLLSKDGEKLPFGAGDRLTLPKGAWHAEGEVTDRMIYIVTFREPVVLMEGLAPLEPKGPFLSYDD